ncbi:DUF7391 family protein [Mycobacterium malmoense]|uniref:DUF7391 family protein n=1 Tax=Mycobacterium malmoense TaxID=1780 RepID=UPI0008F8AF63|nr:hypothetical protein [Mycobacterium malmoense]OIN79348.1 hypothetical protein BMG05_18350 [Mycobacterium malmoense]
MSEPESAAEPAPPEPRKYGYGKPGEISLELPSGNFIRVRKLTGGQLYRFGITEMRDAFAKLLLADPSEPADDEASGEDDTVLLAKVMKDPERREKFFAPIDRAVLAAVVCPKVVAEGEHNEQQVPLDAIDDFDKIVIFSAAAREALAALGEQQEALKSVGVEPPGVLPAVSAVEAVRETAE